ncbi:hypothetical protein M406DRAFT_351339 [Cryphonectria parasitica EP155]|uniref:Uncharacterized protein n=1 Tax=Cryphonectria parasitica (strain ATCC 38755 / EP155) TaxID=660469 RepID=A0A9P4Y3P9_CRYP1|nr:uncharacterized protein M406DRAFT_351339 [Cryphonectria parasitica EP155]KAF3766123.1 hypothetical protein M406DRAFT_351339 [Cryphonectria parasitica EP155]
MATTTPPHHEPDGNFTAEEIAVLHQAGLISDPLPGGKRKASVSLTSPPTSHGSWSSGSSSSPVASIRIKRRPIDAGDQTFEFPTSEESVAALEFMGFNNEVATEIHARFVARSDPDQNPDSILDYAKSFIREIDPYENLPDSEALSLMGINSYLQAVFTDPQHADMMRTETLHYWVCDTLRLNYLTISELHDRCHRFVERGRPSKKKARKSLSETTNLYQPPQSQGESSSAQTQRPVTTEPRYLDRVQLPEGCVYDEGSYTVLPDHYVLYKAQASCEVGRYFLQAAGNVGIKSIARSSGGDFNYVNDAWYFTLEQATAEEYRAWAALRCPKSETWIIRIQVPKTFIASLRMEYLWYGADWKNYVWHCKQKFIPPQRFDRLWQNTDLIKGHICSALPSKIERISREDIQDSMTPDSVLKLPNSRQKCTQWAFMHVSVAMRLAEEIQGKVQIEITPPKWEETS